MSVTVSNLNGALTANQQITSLTVDATTAKISAGDELALVSTAQEVRGIISTGDVAVGSTTIAINAFVLRAAVPDEATVVDRTKVELDVDELVVTDKATEGTNAVTGNETVGGNEAITGNETAATNTP